MVRLKSLRRCSAAVIGTIAIAISLVCDTPNAHATVSCRGMSVRQMIRVSRFLTIDSELHGGNHRHLMISPNGKYVAVVIQRGSLKINRIVDQLKVWSVGEIYSWLKGMRGRPTSLVSFTRMSSGKFPSGRTAIERVRWFDDGNSLVFLGVRSGTNSFGLYQASLTGKMTLLSAPWQDVRYFNVRGRQIVYETLVVPKRSLKNGSVQQDKLPYSVGTGSSLLKLLFPKSLFVSRTDRVHVWRIMDGVRARVPLRSTKFEIRDDVKHVLSISPKQDSIVMNLAVKYVPPNWMHYGKTGKAIWTKTGSVPTEDYSYWVPHQYVLVNVVTGKMRALTGGPSGESRGFYTVSSTSGRIGKRPSAVWAPSGGAVLLWNTFVNVHSSEPRWSKRWGVTRPCLAVVNVTDLRERCVNGIRGGASKATLVGARWQKVHKKGPDRLLVSWMVGAKFVRREYCLKEKSEKWIVKCATRANAYDKQKFKGLRLGVTQNLNSPPRLVAYIVPNGVKEVLDDPNRSLRKKCIGVARVINFNVKMQNGIRVRITGGLLLPVDYVAGRLYPLVIQTHGFQSRRFMSSGYSVPFVARALSASGMAVMQIPDCYWRTTRRVIEGTPEELPCDVRVFRGAIQFAMRQGFVDPNEIGIIGFSATCEEVLAMLEKKNVHVAAAELVDGVVGTYSQYVDTIDFANGFFNAYDEGRFGGPPIGSGLTSWISRSPGFSLYKVRAPVLIEANGRLGALVMWEPYAILHYLGRPADFVVIRRGTHPFSNPMQQLAVQDIGLAWFRFWLQQKCPVSKMECRRWERMKRSRESVSG